MHSVTFSSLYGGAYISCSPGVYETDSTIWFWRGLGNLIGYSNGVGYPNQINGTIGTCSPGTNSYTDELDYTMYTPAGADYFSHSGSTTSPASRT